LASKQRYQVVERIDVGGMAEIYKGKGLSLQGIEKTVAIKRILPALTSKPKFVTMFLDEARLAMRLNHSNIAQVFDVGRSGGTYFLIMEYVEGVNLRRVMEFAVERGERIPVHLALYAIAEVCKGLSYAHNLTDEAGHHLGIVHRDMSPSNVLISSAGEVKVTDFGLAKAVTHVEFTDPGIIKGKFSYLYPEAMAQKAPVDHRADLFSVGIILWEMLAGRRLFMAETDARILELVERAEIPSLRAINPDVSPELEDVVNKALARLPEQRFQSASAMGDAVMDLLYKRGTKVSSYDLAEFIRSVSSAHTQADQEDPVRRIQSLLKEQILNLSMVGTRPGLGASPMGVAVDPSKPLVDSLLRLEKLKTTSEFHDIWDVEQVDQVKRDDLFQKKQESQHKRVEGDNRQAKLFLAGLVVVFLILLVLFLVTR
jgi:serine/threonine-protein kinase